MRATRKKLRGANLGFPSLDSVNMINDRVKGHVSDLSEVENTGKMLGVSKRIVRWRFGWSEEESDHETH